MPNPYNLTTDLRGDPSVERTWVEPAVKRVEFDLYDVGNAITYCHTLRLPIEGTPVVYGTGNVGTARDTTVHVYRLSGNAP